MKSSSRKGLIMIAVAGACGLAACGGDNTSDTPAAVGGVSQGMQTQPNVASASNLAAGTTSASDAALPRVVANVEGLADNTSLTLFVDYDEAVVTKTNVAVAWPATLSPRKPKAVTIAVQPKGQHCDIDRGKNNPREAVSLPVSVRCKERGSIVVATYSEPNQLVVSSIRHDTGEIREAASDRVDLPAFPMRTVRHPASNTVYVAGYDEDRDASRWGEFIRRKVEFPVYDVDTYSGKVQKYFENLQAGSLEWIDDIALDRTGEHLYAIGPRDRFGLATLDVEDGRVKHMIRTESDLIPTSNDEKCFMPTLGGFRPSPNHRGWVSTPDEHYAYMLECDAGSGSYRLRGFSVDVATARFTPRSRFSSGVSDLNIIDFAINPQGTLLYLLPEGVRKMYAFRIDRETGMLSPVATPTVPLENDGRMVTVSPDGTRVFVGHPVWHRSSVAAYVANPKTGSLHPVAIGRFEAATNVRKIVIDASQTYMYLIGSYLSPIAVYTLPTDLNESELIQSGEFTHGGEFLKGFLTELSLPS